MVLSDKDIKKAIKNGDIIIDPFDKKCIGPASIDLRLGRYLLVYKIEECCLIDPKKKLDNMMREIILYEKKPFIIHPGGFALGVVYEKTGVSDKYLGRLDGKSSVGRMGLLIHVTAGILDPGNCLNLTLELHNTANIPILLYYKMPIAQMIFEQLLSPCEVSYPDRQKSKYVQDVKPKASQMWRNFQK